VCLVAGEGLGEDVADSGRTHPPISAVKVARVLPKLQPGRTARLEGVQVVPPEMSIVANIQRAGPHLIYSANVRRCCRRVALPLPSS
jgi:hypothetical protein